MRVHYEENGTVKETLAGTSTAKKTITIGLPQQLVEQLRDECARRGLSLSLLIQERCSGEVVRLAPAVLLRAQPLTAMGNRIAKALDLTTDDVVRAELHKAQSLLSVELLKLRAPYDTDLDAMDQALDDWSGRR